MAIITKKINGYGPYKYKVEYVDGEHVWTYLGPAGDGDSSDGQTDSSDDEQVGSSVKDADYFDVETETLVGEESLEGVDQQALMESVVDELEEGDLVRLDGKTYTVDGFSKGLGGEKIKTKEGGTIGWQDLDPSGTSLEKVTSNYDPTLEHRAVRFGPSEEKTKTWNLAENGTSSLSITETTDQSRDTVLVESPYEAKDEIKALDEDGFDPTWNGSQWEVSMDAVPDLVTRLRESDADGTSYVEVSADILAQSGTGEVLPIAEEYLKKIDG